MDLLDKAKAATGSDTKTAKYLKMSQGNLADVRAGKRRLTPFQAAKLAELVGERWYDVALPILADKAKTRLEREFWMGKLETLRKTAAPACLAAFLALTPQDGEARQGSPNNQISNGPLIHYENNRRVWKRRGRHRKKPLQTTRRTVKRNPRKCGGFHSGPRILRGHWTGATA